MNPGNIHELRTFRLAHAASIAHQKEEAGGGEGGDSCGGGGGGGSDSGGGDKDRGRLVVNTQACMYT